MPTEFGRGKRPSSATITVTASPVLELIATTWVCRKFRDQPGDFEPPFWYSRATAAQRETLERYETLWRDIPADEPLELQVLAAMSGTLIDPNPERFFALWERTCQRPAPEPLVPIEPPDQRMAIARRLDRLRESPELRAQLLELLKGQWEVIEPEWEREGRRRVELEVESYKRELRKAEDPLDVIPPWSMAHLDRFSDAATEALGRGELYLVPVYLMGEGQGVLALPGMFVVELGVDFGQALTRRQERLHKAAASFKLLSDPTRLAMLRYLVSYAGSVSDLARVFEVSQPTASVHLKALREAGLLTAQKQGNLTLYSASAERVRELIDESAHQLLKGASEPLHGS